MEFLVRKKKGTNVLVTAHEKEIILLTFASGSLRNNTLSIFKYCTKCSITKTRPHAQTSWIA